MSKLVILKYREFRRNIMSVATDSSLKPLPVWHGKILKRSVQVVVKDSLASLHF